MTDIESKEKKIESGVKCLVERKINGVSVVQFQPTSQMRLFALSAICDPAFRGKEPEEICLGIGLGKSAFKGFLKFEPYFSEWFEDCRLALGGRSRKQMLEMVGMEKALSGEFNFWKAMSIKEGLISPDTLNIGAAIPSNLGQFKDMSDEQLSAAENSIMAALSGKAQSPTIDLIESDSGWRPEGDSPGTGEVHEGPVVLPATLGFDGEPGIEE